MGSGFHKTSPVQINLFLCEQKEDLLKKQAANFSDIAVILGLNEHQNVVGNGLRIPQNTKHKSNFLKIGLII